MSGIRDMNLTRLYQSLHERGETTLTLADKLVTSRSYVSRMLGGYERHGTSWKRLLRLLTPSEIALVAAVPERPAQQTVLRRSSEHRVASSV